ncbi:MAG: DUF2125 domain-containing protein [Rhodobacteraceae bacterium]|nr:DUF2125 domain-containing protein [Paracoccaceae bacterium]
MRPLLWLTFLLAGLYAAYWFVGSHALLTETETALAQMKAEGRADYTSLELHGFPSRFDLTVTAPKLVSADGQQSWQAEFVQFLALSYQPNRLIAVWPHEQTLTRGRETLTLRSDDLRASLALTAGLSLPLDHAELEGHGLDLVSDRGWQILAEKLILASRQAGPDAKSHQLALTLTGLAPGNDLRRRIDPQGSLPALVETARATVTADFDRALDRGLITQEPHLTALRAIDGAFRWGPLGLAVTGDLEIDTGGTPSGRLDLSITGWRELLDLLTAAGVVSPDMASNLKNGLAAIATGTGTGATSEVKMPLLFDGGFMRLGPFPLGPAPRL